MTKPKVSKLKKVADTIFSKCRRKENADHRGLVRCFTCGKVDEWQKMDCGHYESRQFNNTRYSEINTQVQCKGCNIFKGGNKTIFAVKLREKYGEGILEKLRKEAQKIKQFSIPELEEMIIKFKTELSKLC